jgi:hypothetical protein
MQTPTIEVFHLEFQSVTDTFSSEQFISNRFGDRYLYSINRHAFDHIGAESVYRGRWGETLFEENTLYILAGCDSGLLISYLQKKGLPKGSRYLIVELPEVNALVEPLINHDERVQKIQICTLDNWFELARKNSFAEYAYLDSVKVLRSLAVEDGYLTEYRNLWRVLEQNIQQTLWIYQKEKGNSTFVVRQIENVCENRHSAYCLKGLFKEKTAVLLAGGPSLDSILPWVLEHRSNLIVVAVSRISRRLQDVDLNPDLVVTVDPHACSFDVSKHMLRFYKNSVLVNAYHATPLLVGQWAGTSLYLGNRYPWKTNDNVNTITGVGPTVSNSAINLMVEMGCKQIILAGLDLCFTQEGFSHAKGSDERNAGPFLSYATQTVKTNAGKTAETDNGFYNAIQTIEKQAEYALNRGCQLINPSPNSAAINKVQYIPLEDIEISTLKTPAIETILSAVPNETSERRLTDYREAGKQIDKAEYNLGKVKELARKALSHNDGLFGRNGKKASFKHKLQMDKIEKQLNKDYGDFASLCKLFGMKEFIQTLSPTDDDQWSDDEIESKGRLYYNAFICGADNLLKITKACKKRILSRIEEEQPNPDFDLVAKQWKSDNQPGRAKVWEILNSENANALPNSTKLKLEALNEILESELENAEHNHIKQIQRYASLNGVASKGYELYRNGDKEGLNRLLKGLQARSDHESRILFALVSGYAAETNDRTNEAIENYHTVVVEEENTENPALENALSRLAYLALEHHELEEASSYLEALSGLSASYMPQYAEILRMTNNLQRSIDAYTEYLSFVPEDLTTMMKLALLYKDIGVNEGARYLFEHIIAKDPHNEAARDLLKQVKMSA